MPLSRPILVLAFMALMVAGAAWYAPPQDKTTQIAVMVPSATYKLLAARGEAEGGADGRPRSVAQVIETLARD